MDMRSLLAAREYTASRPATGPAAPDDARHGVERAFADFEQTLRAAEDTAMATMTRGGDPHALVQALAQSELAVETAVVVRDKVVEAYQEILRMPV